MRCTAGLPFLFSEGAEVRLVPPVIDAPRCVHVARAEAEGLDGGVVWFEEVESANEAKLLVGCHCLVPRATVDEATCRSTVGEDDLDVSGWEAYEVDEGYLGVVREVREMPGQLMLVINRSSCDELLVPVVDEFIVDLDEESRRIDLSLPVGLLSL